MIPVTSSLSLLLNYNVIEHMHKNKHNGNNFNTGANNDDFFEDDFEEIGDGQIPF